MHARIVGGARGGTARGPRGARRPAGDESLDPSTARSEVIPERSWRRPVADRLRRPAHEAEGGDVTTAEKKKKYGLEKPLDETGLYEKLTKDVVGRTLD